MWKYESLPIRFGVVNCNPASTTTAARNASRTSRRRSGLSGSCASRACELTARADDDPTTRKPSMDQPADPLPSHPAVLAVPRPVDDERLPLHVVERHEAPEAAVVATVAVVAHDEHLVGRDRHRSVVVARHETALVARPVDEVPVRVVDLLVVHVDLFVADLDRVPRLTDDALDEILVRIHRVHEHDDVAAPRIRELHDALAEERQANPVAELVDEDVVADLQRRQHRSRGNLEGL